MARRSTSLKTSRQRAVAAIVEADPFRPTLPDAPQARARVPDEVVESPLLMAIASVPPPAPAAEPAAEPAPPPSADPCDISGQFFAQEIDSVPPPVEMPTEPQEPPEPPHVAARRARARRVITAAVAVMGVFALVAAGKAMAARAARPGAVVAAAAQYEEMGRAQLPKAAAQPEPAAEPPAAPVAEPAKQAEPAPAAAAPARPEAPVQPEAQQAQPDKPADTQAEPAAAPAADAAKLRKEAESLANRGRYADAIVASRAAIEADPSHALPYLLLGTSLQMSGKWKDGVGAYCECVRNATRGPVGECRASGGHK